MCVGVAGQIKSIDGASAVVDFAGSERKISLLMLEGLEAGDWIVAHSGFAVKPLTADEARANLECVVEALTEPKS